MSQAQDFSSYLKSHFAALCERVFSELHGDERALLQLDAEHSLFLRFNRASVRQNTDVEQRVLSLDFQSGGRSVERALSLTGDLEQDTTRVASELKMARAEAAELPPDPFQVAFKNNGSSEQDFTGELPHVSALIEGIIAPAAGFDLSGLYCGGPVVSANQNSLGQKHWFSTRSFFLDYSLYDGARAAKSVYADRSWKASAWRENVLATHEQLKLLSRPLRDVKPGAYRTYLAPAAVAELSGMLSWNALSYAAYRQGRCPFRRLADNEGQLSPLLSIEENFDLGLRPAFNSLGEVSATRVPLIEKGTLRSLLVSSRSAAEYGVASNQASVDEGPRALDMATGALKRENILQEIDTGLYLSNLHYLNWSDLVSARVTGMTRYACFWVENGEIQGPIKDMRFDASLFDILGGQLRAVTDFREIHPATGTYSARSLGGERVPGLLIDGFRFTL